MKLIDDQGRVFGQVSLVDLGVIVLLGSLAPLSSYGYRALTTVEVECAHPGRIVNTEAHRVVISGRNFHRDSIVRIGGQRVAPVWFVTHRWLEVTLPSDFPVGAHPVEVVNPDGQSGTAAGLLVAEAPLAAVTLPEEVAQVVASQPTHRVAAVFAFDPSAKVWLAEGVKGGRDEQGELTIEILSVVIGSDPGWRNGEVRSALQERLERERRVGRGLPELSVRRGWLVALLSLSATIEPVSNEEARFSYRGQLLAPGVPITMSIRGQERTGFLLSWPVPQNTQPIPIVESLPAQVEAHR